MEKKMLGVSLLVLALLVVGAGCEKSAQTDVMMKDGAVMDNGNTSGDVMEGKMMDNSDSAIMKTEEGAMLKADVEVKTDMMMEKDGGSMMKDGMMKASMKGAYDGYADDKLSYADKGDVVLFFHASWCPTCRSAEQSLTSNTIPDGLLVLKINYDASSELKKKYGVTSQHTFVQVDANGNMIKKWLGSGSATEIAAQVRS
jgi:thiol-disulfide isomerase/thioredoxin